MSISAHFEDIDQLIKKALLEAKFSVKICVAWISEISYVNIIYALAQKGVIVEVIYNDDHINAKNKWRMAPKLLMYPLKNIFGRSLMHNKFCIIDDATLITGSFNWSKSAIKHFENIILTKEEYPLIESFLHEFEDLKNYAERLPDWSSIKCQSNPLWPSGTNGGCRSPSFNIGIIGNGDGKYLESSINVWNICFKHYHVTHLHQWHDQFLLSQLGLSEDEYVEDEPPADGPSMRERFQRERDKIADIQYYFQKGCDKPIHAVGIIGYSNETHNIRYREPLQREVQVIWRDMYYRKVVPSVLHDDGEIEKIIYSQQY